MKTRSITLMTIVTASLGLAGATLSPPIRNVCAQQAHTSYAEDIAPILRGWCVSCHQPGGQGYEASGLDLTSYDGLMKGTKFGPMVIAGQPDSSNLVVLVEGKAKLQMPYGHKPLPDCLRKNMWTWVFEGAKNN
jgi:mono/diheme cytochrome c family protein